jgi:hypothetical protein
MSARLIIAVAAIGLNGVWAQAQTVTPPVTAPSTTAQPAAPTATVPVAAQPQPRTGEGASPAATSTMTEKSAATTATEKPPLKGANSFTETQARERIIKSGFSSVETLSKDADGIWRAKGTKSGKSTAVALDFKGNIVETP